MSADCSRLEVQLHWWPRASHGVPVLVRNCLGFFCHFLPYKTRCKMRLGCLRVEARRQRTVLRSHPAAVRRCHSKHTHIELGHQRPVNVRGLHSWRGRLECPPEVCHRASSLIYVCGCTFCNSTFLFFFCVSSVM